MGCEGEVRPSPQCSPWVPAAGCGPGWHGGLLGRGGDGIVTEWSTMPGPGSDSRSPERNDSAVRLRAALKMGCSPQRRWKLFCSRQLPGGGSNVHFKPRNPRPRWGPARVHTQIAMVGVHMVTPGSQKADGEAESDPVCLHSRQVHVQAELTPGGASRRVVPFVEPWGVDVVCTSVWRWSHRCGHMPIRLCSSGSSLCVSSVNTESRWHGSGVAGTLRPLPAAPAPIAPPFLFSQQTLAGNVCADDAKFQGYKHSFIHSAVILVPALVGICSTC